MARDASKRPTPRKKSGGSAGKALKAPAAPSGRGRSAALRPAARTAPAAPARAKAPRQAPPQFSGSRAPHPAQRITDRPRDCRERHQRFQAARAALLVLGGLLALALVVAVALFALRDAPVFEITAIEFEPTEHISTSDVENLAQVPAGSTLLNVDTAQIEESLRQNPWVGEVSFDRLFPGTLRITISEQEPDMLVVMSSGSIAWYLGDSGSWIEPVSLGTEDGQSVSDVALALAQELGCLLVIDVPATVDPSAGSPATDAVIEAINEFRSGFTEAFSSQIVCFSAPSVENVSCVLASGVEVSLGSATDIPEKESIVTTYLEENPGSIIYINVRVVSSPAFRDIGSENVQQGEGVTVPELSGDDASGGASDEPTDSGSGADADSGEGSDSSSDEGESTQASSDAEG